MTDMQYVQTQSMGKRSGHPSPKR